ncbi:MAG TPA: guanylate cyclase, partial [Chitinophagaceae bacterium]|nr:guanylate cyclase [Chitinophagaceae bacterium]
YAMSAAAYSYLGATGQILPDQAFAVVHRYADKALELDSTIAESHIAKANAYLFYDWKWEEAYQALRKALELNPASIEALDLLGYYYVIVGKKELAVRSLQQAEQLDPLSPVIAQSLGSMYIFAGMFDEAVRQADKMLEINPRMRISIEMKGWAFGMKGDWPTALKLFEEVHRLTNHPLKGLMGLGFAYAKLGMTDEALEVIRKMEQRQREEPGSVIDADLAGVWFGLGNYDKAFYYINQCIDKRMGPVSYFLEYPAYDGIKNDPRYTEVQKRMGLYFDKAEA